MFWVEVQHAYHPVERLIALVDAAQFKTVPPRVGDELKWAREDFNTKVCVQKRFPLTVCFVCWHDNHTDLVRHHIIPLGAWGSNRRYNVITVCKECHSLIHPWLRRSARWAYNSVARY